MIRRTLRHTWRLSALLLVLLALLVSAARFGVPWLQDQRQQLLDWLVEDPAIQSDLQGLGARWSDYGPAVTLHGLTLQQKRSEPWQLRVENATVQLDLWQSLQQWQWVIGNLQFQGVELVVPKRLLHSDSGGQGDQDDERHQQLRHERQRRQPFLDAVPPRHKTAHAGPPSVENFRSR